MLVLSAPPHLQRRKAVRDTWGGVVKSTARSRDREGTEGRVGLVFLLGEVQEGEEVSSEAVRRESEEHGDLVQWERLHDSYFNLTLKVGIFSKALFFNTAETGLRQSKPNNFIS